MIKHVLDASAVLAFLRGEPGGERVQAVVAGSVVGAVNLSEVVSKLIDKGSSAPEAIGLVAALPCRIAPFDHRLGLRTGSLREATRAQGLSLGDRACLALSEAEGAPVLTADRSWASLDLPVEVVLIR